MGVRLACFENGVVRNDLESSLVMNVKAKQGDDPNLVELKKEVVEKAVEGFFQGGDGVL